MSFGASPSDIIIVVTFCKALYRKCRDAGGEYDEISREVRGLHTVLRHLKYEVEAPESSLNRDRSIWSRQLAPIIGDCDFTLRQLDGLLQKYGRLNSSSASSSPSSPRIPLDKVRLGSNEMDTLGTVRVKLISHKTSLTQFLDAIQLHESGEVSQALDNHGGQLDIILDKVDGIAARMAPPRREESVLTSYEDDDREVWKQFRRELIAEGFSSDVLQQHKDLLRAYIREIDQKGLLDDVSPNSHISPQARVNPERWLEEVHTGSTEDRPPSFSSLGAATDDSGAKEMVVREENMKFPQSMKMARPKPETRRDGRRRLSNQLDPNPSRDRRASGNSHRRPSPVPRLITSSDEKDEKDVVYFNTSGSDSDTESETSSKGSKRPEMGLVIRTSDLLASSQALTLRPMSPSSFRSSQGSFGDDDVVRSMAQRQRRSLEYGTSPSRTGAMAIPIPPSSNPRKSIDSLGTSPRPDPVMLAPDEHGNEIPADAKWTKINRRLVSPEVLSQDGRRYEARPDFVAVLGVLSRAEIESLATRSYTLRQARQARHAQHHARSQSTPQHPSPSQAPVQPPRPTTLPIPMPIPVPNFSTSPRSPFTHRDHTPSSSSASDSEDSDDGIRERGVRKRRPKPPRSYASSNAGIPVSGYPNQYGSPLPPSPLWSPSSSAAGWHGPERKSNALQREKERDSERDYDSLRDHESSRDVHRGDKTSRGERDRGERGSERERERRRQSSRSGHLRPNERRERERDRAPPQQKSSRWKEHMTAAGIGGAAASLLNVLTEAAEGL